MSEIEKLYINANVEDKNINNQLYRDLNYPQFTAEKQLELIKFLGDVRDYTVEIDKFKGVYYVGCRSAGSNDKLWGSSNTFKDALAELINETWFCLTEEEKEQIRGILK